MSKIVTPKEKYLSRYKQPKVEFEKDNEDKNTAFIYTERFTIESFHSTGNSFEEYPEKVRKLYDVTFGDATVMSKFGEGKVKTKEQFENQVTKINLWWENNYKFTGFSIHDDTNDQVVGFASIANCSSRENTAEISCILNKDYQKSATIKGVGYECKGALVLSYGTTLYKQKCVVNQVYNHETKAFEGGQAFTKIYSTSRTDNPGSYIVSEYIGSIRIGTIEKFGAERYEYELNFDEKINEVDLSGISVEV